MADFTNIQRVGGLTAEQARRIGRRNIVPTSVKGRFLPQDILVNSSVDTGTFNFADGVVITITSTTFHSIDPDIRLGLLPFMVSLFNTSTLSGVDPGTNQIPYDTTTGNFDLYGPTACPNFTVNSKRDSFASDGNNVVYKVGVRNSSGGAEDVFYIIQTRAIISRGGQ